MTIWIVEVNLKHGWGLFQTWEIILVYNLI